MTTQVLLDMRFERRSEGGQIAQYVMRKTTHLCGDIEATINVCPDHELEIGETAARSQAFYALCELIAKEETDRLMAASAAIAFETNILEAVGE